MKIIGGAKRDKARDVDTDYGLEQYLIKDFTYKVIKVGGAMPFRQTILKDFKRDDIANKDSSHKATAEVQQREENLNRLWQWRDREGTDLEISFFYLKKTCLFPCC